MAIDVVLTRLNSYESSIIITFIWKFQQPINGNNLHISSFLYIHKWKSQAESKLNLVSIPN